MRKLLFLVMIVLTACQQNGEQSAEVTTEAIPEMEVNQGTIPPDDSTKSYATITIPTGGDIVMTANLYDYNPNQEVIIMCHQAGYNKAEYNEIAKKMFDYGFNCLVIDQRSGGTIPNMEVENNTNETAKNAQGKGLNTEYLDAMIDIQSAVRYAYKKYNKPIFLWGSSYSASLALKVGAEMDEVRAILAFSPGEYFGTKLKIKKAIKDLEKPVFVTSSYSESVGITNLVDELPKSVVTQFIPSGSGEHGSKALWSTHPDEQEYWFATKNFIKTQINRSR